MGAMTTALAAVAGFAGGVVFTAALIAAALNRFNVNPPAGLFK